MIFSIDDIKKGVIESCCTLAYVIAIRISSFIEPNEIAGKAKRAKITTIK